ncbi:MAG: ABC transporter ATP-binding protein [Candidatus Bipolaricaulia bacterium]
MIETHELSKRFGERTAVEALTLEVEQGEVLGFLGPNGAGKTTTIRMLTGIIAPTSGYALVAGRRTDREVERLHEVIGLLPEIPGFYSRLSARRNLEFFAGFYAHIDAAAQVEKYLRLMGLWERRDDRVGTFSKGMEQRLALARALLHEPTLLFLDEPTSGLDPEAAREVRELIAQLRGEGRTIFLSTHNLAEAEQLCDRIAVIRTRLVALERPEGLRRRLFRRRVVVRLVDVDSAIIEAARGLESVQGLERDGDRLIVELAEPERERPELVRRIVEAGGRVLEVAEERHSLEEVYLSLVREGEDE